MKRSASYEIHGKNILAITYTGPHPHGQCFDWVRAVLQNDPQIPPRFGLLIDLRPAMDSFEFEDLLDLARFWASQRHRITSLAAVVDLSSSPQWPHRRDSGDDDPRLNASAAGFRIFNSKVNAVRWLDPACCCHTNVA